MMPSSTDQVFFGSDLPSSNFKPSKFLPLNRLTKPSSSFLSSAAPAGMSSKTPAIRAANGSKRVNREMRIGESPLGNMNHSPARLLPWQPTVRPRRLYAGQRLGSIGARGVLGRWFTGRWPGYGVRTRGLGHEPVLLTCLIGHLMWGGLL